MLRELTKEQQKIALETREFWHDFLFSCKNELNKEQAIECVNFLYELVGLEKPQVIFCDSPFAAQKIEIKLRQKYVCDKFRNKIANEFFVLNTLANGFMFEVKEKINKYFFNSVFIDVFLSVYNVITCKNYYDNLHYGICNYYLCSMFNFYEKSKILPINDDVFLVFNKLKNLILSGIYEIMLFENTCIVVGLPNKILLDENNKLHSDSESAISFRDGFELFFKHGVNVDRI